jgi:molecular chaperone HtpG
LWARNKNDITEDEYQAFYKHVSHDFENALSYTHSRVEGKQEYISLLYIPSKAPFDLYDRERRHGIKLYVKRVFIMEDAEKLMPQYLRFVRGVIDTSDLPLNVSREILQSSRDVDAIKAGSVKKVLSLLEDMAENKPDDYAKFYGEFGRVLKEGPGEDFANKDKIAGLLRFASTKADTEAQTVSLKDYIARMQPEQELIYYITAESFAAAQHSPHLEIFRKKGIEVLLLSDRVDEWLLGSLTEFDGKKLQSIAKGDLDLGKLESDTEKDIQKKIEEEAKSLVEKIKTSLGEQVKDVRVTHRLTDSPACLVSDANDLSGNLARMLKAAGQAAPESKPILEINPGHKLVKRLEAEAADAVFNDLALVLFDQALLAEGGSLNDPASFVKRMNSLIV